MDSVTELPPLPTIALATGFTFTEGPIWHPGEQVLYFSDMPGDVRRKVSLDGTVTEVLPSATFRVHLTNGHDVLATMAGKMRRFRIRVLQGDRVSVEVSPYDLSRGRITFRHKT